MSQQQNGLAALNQCSKEIDDVYHSYASGYHLSDAAFWVLYYVWEYGLDRPCTQREICDAWSYSPQTVNSALKMLEAKGFVLLEPTDGNRKSKHIFLTESGHLLAEQVIVSLVNAELEAFSSLTCREQRELAQLMQKYTAAFRENVRKLQR